MACSARGIKASEPSGEHWTCALSKLATRQPWRTIHYSPLFRLLPSSGYLEQMLRERSRAIDVARLGLVEKAESESPVHAGGVGRRQLAGNTS